LLELADQPGESISSVARQYGVAPSLMFKWRRLLEQGGEVSLQANEPTVAESEVKELKVRVRELERLLGRKTMEVEILQEAVRIGREKNYSRGGRCCRRAVADDPRGGGDRRIAIEPSSSAWTAVDGGGVCWIYPRRGRGAVGARPTCGRSTGQLRYRRVAALLNREHGARKVNHKRVYRVMRAAGLLLQRYTGKSTRTHDGKIITLTSNMRWCSDSFEVRCWDGQRVQVVFALDCCDREVIAWVATTAAITGEMVRDLMAESVEARFGATARRTPHPVQRLSDNGPPYTANETREFGEAAGIVVCTTPAYSPESNGMAEAFVKTFRRDYVHLNRLDTAEEVMRALAEWFDDYNSQHPHKGLNMMSPRAFRLQTAAR
jgi:transposase InsO family protein/transposase-like protein